MWQLQTQIGQQMPVSLVLITDGRVGKIAFIITSQFDVIHDQDGEGNTIAIFRRDGFSIGEEEFTYRVAYPYKEIPQMLEWLKKQNLQKPMELDM